jgi:hypothetical protein
MDSSRKSASGHHGCPSTEGQSQYGDLGRHASSAAAGGRSNASLTVQAKPLILAAVGRKRLVAVAILGIAVLVACGREPAPRLDLRVDLSERVNAVYHLACLAESISCTKELFERFWKDRLGWREADAAAVGAWRDAMTKLTNSAPPRPPAPLLPNTQRFHPGQAARTAAVVAALESSFASDLVRRSGSVVDPETAAIILKAVDHVEQRLLAWFRTTARGRVEARVSQVTSRARQGRFTETATQMMAFLEAELTDPALYVHAIAGPEPASEDFTATQIGNHFLVEVVDTATADDVVSGAVHELTHYIYDRAPAEKHLALIEEFAASGAASYSGLYTYLNEAIAIAAHGIHADKNRETPDDDRSYRHPYIDPLGTATIPLVKNALSRNATLFDGFASAYIAAGTSVLGDKLSEPRFVLAQVGLLLPDRADQIRAAYFRHMVPQASAQFRSEDETAAFPELNVVRFARYDEPGTLDQRVNSIDELRRHRGFAYALPRGRTAHMYLLAGRDDVSIVEVIERFAETEALPHEGLVISLD